MKINLKTGCSGDWEGKPFSFGGGETGEEVSNGLGAELIRAGFAEEASASGGAPADQAPADQAPADQAPAASGKGRK